MRLGVPFCIRIKRRAAKELQSVRKETRVPLAEAVDALRENPLAGSPLKGGLRGLRRLRVGDYRILYEVLDGELVILVVRVSHRREAYRSG